MSRYVFTDAEVQAAAEELGLWFAEFHEAKSVVGLPQEYRNWQTEPWEITWTGDLTINEKGEIKVTGISNLAWCLVEKLLEQRRTTPNICVTLSKYTLAELAPIGKATGMRLVCLSKSVPERIYFVPDMSRAGEVQVVDPYDTLELHEALQADPDQRPVVISASDLQALISLVPNDINPSSAALVNRLLDKLTTPGDD